MAERVGDVEGRLGGPGLSLPVDRPFRYRLAALIHAGGPRLGAVGKGHQQLGQLCVAVLLNETRHGIEPLPGVDLDLRADRRLDSSWTGFAG
jgi:hypothetical protein